MRTLNNMLTGCVIGSAMPLVLAVILNVFDFEVSAIWIFLGICMGMVAGAVSYFVVIPRMFTLRSVNQEAQGTVCFIVAWAAVTSFNPAFLWDLKPNLIVFGVLLAIWIVVTFLDVLFMRRD